MLQLMQFRSIFLSVIFAAVVPATATAKQGATRRTSMLRKAEIAANRIVERFHKTLDFSGIFADEFVTNPRLRALAVSFDAEDKWKQFDLPTRERVYVAMMTSLHLWGEYMLIQKEHDVPLEIDRLNPKPRLFTSSNPPQTLAELNQDIADLERTSAMYRKYFPDGVFQSEEYRENLRQGVQYAKSHSHNVPRIVKGNIRFGIPESVSVYVVRPEVFDYYFIEEKGTMKLFYVDFLPNFRLF